MKFRLKPTQQIIVAAVVFGVLIMALIAFLLIPQLLAARSASDQESKAMQELETAKGNLKVLEDAKRQTRKTEAVLLRLSRRAPTNDAELPALVIQLEDISKRAGIDFVMVKPSAPVQKDQYAEIPLEIRMDGFFYELLDFLYRLEKLPRLATIETIEIKEGKQKLPNIEITLKGTTYMLTPGVKAAAAGTTGAAGGGTTGAAPTGTAGGGATQ